MASTGRFDILNWVYSKHQARFVDKGVASRITLSSGLTDTNVSVGLKTTDASSGLTDMNISVGLRQ